MLRCMIVVIPLMERSRYGDIRKDIMSVPMGVRGGGVERTPFMRDFVLTITFSEIIPDTSG